MKRVIKKTSFHPIAFATLPVLYLFQRNVVEVTAVTFLFSLLFVIAGTVAASHVVEYFFKEKERAAIVTSVFCLIFLVGGSTREYAPKILPPLVLWAIQGGMSIFLIWVAVRLSKRLKDHQVAHLTRSLNRIACFLVFFQIAMAGYEKSKLPPPPSGQSTPESKAAIINGFQPDVYYIIVDGYASFKALESEYKYSNQPFHDFLAKAGFYISENSRANYPETIVSLPSSLNMQFLHESEVWEPTTDNRDVLVEMLANNQLIRQFKGMGYKTIQVNSGFYRPTRANPHVDKNFGGLHFDEFSTTLSMWTLLYPVAEILTREAIRHSNLQALTDLETAAEEKGPKFIFAHLMGVHGPFVFDREGKRPNIHGVSWTEKSASSKARYLNQLVFITEKLKSTIERILRSSKIEPIIILQSDHGPMSYSRVDLTPPSDHRELERAFDSQTRILNAYLVPPRTREKLYDTVSPVNSFRLLFNSCFGASFPLLPDKTNYYFGMHR